MGRWSRHPMGSDGALDAKSIFFEEFVAMNHKNWKKDEYYFDRPAEEIRDYLNSLTKEDLERIISDPSYVGKIIRGDRFVIPYIYKEYKATPKDDEVKQFLFECFDYHDDITGEWNYCSETDENGEVLELKHIRIFKENFDAIMSGKMDLPDDEGLFAALFDAVESNGLINKR